MNYLIISIGIALLCAVFRLIQIYKTQIRMTFLDGQEWAKFYHSKANEGTTVEARKLSNKKCHWRFPALPSTAKMFFTFNLWDKLGTKWWYLRNTARNPYQFDESNK